MIGDCGPYGDVAEVVGWALKLWLTSGSNIGAKVKRQPSDEVSADLIRRLRSRGVEILHLLDDRLGLQQQLLAGRRQRQSLGMAPQELGVELDFKPCGRLQ